MGEVRMVTFILALEISEEEGVNEGEEVKVGARAVGLGVISGEAEGAVDGEGVEGRGMVGEVVEVAVGVWGGGGEGDGVG